MASENDNLYVHNRGRHIPNYRREYYVDGNTVRRYSAAPSYRPEREQRPEHQPGRHPRKKPVSMPGIDGASFVFLMCAFVSVVVVAFSFITTQNSVHEMKKEVVSLQSEISNGKIENDERYESILATVDLAEVYEKATEELNMVRAENNQIFTYKNKKSDMVKQYADIPSDK